MRICRRTLSTAFPAALLIIAACLLRTRNHAAGERNAARGDDGRDVDVTRFAIECTPQRLCDPDNRPSLEIGAARQWRTGSRGSGLVEECSCLKAAGRVHKRFAVVAMRLGAR